MLFEHQKKAIEFLLSKKGAILADEMGLGKTRSALEAAKRLGLKTAVFCPAFLVPTWRREAETVGVGPPVLSYERAQKELDEIPEILILDESHYIKSRKTKRALFALDVCTAVRERGGYVWLLSGTPVTRDVDDLYTQLVAINRLPRKAGKVMSYWRFCDEIMQKAPCRFTRVGYKHEGVSGRGRAILEDLLQDCSLKRYKKDVLDLPGKTYEKIYLKGISKKLVDDVANSIAREKNLEDLRFDHHFMSRQKALAVAKAEAVIPFFEDKSAEGVPPFVVFTTSLNAVDRLATLPHARVITGKTAVTQRAVIVDAFQAGKVPVLICTIAAAGVGLTLTRADTVYFIDRDFSVAQNRQAEDRLHRIGQKNQVTVVDFLSEHPQEERLYEILVQKTGIIQTVEELHAD